MVWWTWLLIVALVLFVVLWIVVRRANKAKAK